jgi:hypothetical protein
MLRQSHWSGWTRLCRRWLLRRGRYDATVLQLQGPNEWQALLAPLGVAVPVVLRNTPATTNQMSVFFRVTTSEQLTTSKKP